jgi:hypothetical protein
MKFPAQTYRDYDQTHIAICLNLLLQMLYTHSGKRFYKLNSVQDGSGVDCGVAMDEDVLSIVS